MTTRLQTKRQATNSVFMGLFETLAIKKEGSENAVRQDQTINKEETRRGSICEHYHNFFHTVVKAFFIFFFARSALARFIKPIFLRK